MTATSTKKVTSVVFTDDGKRVGVDKAGSGGVYSVAWHTAKLTKGKHTVTATVVDAAGQSATRPRPCASAARAGSVRVAVVTGASSGIGAELVRTLRAQGWRTVGVSRRPSEADEHEECDVADRAAVEALAARVLERHPRIDLLVNNAGFTARHDFVGRRPGRDRGDDPARTTSARCG